MQSPKKKTATFNPEGIGTLTKNKPVVYKILDSDGDNIYTGIAKRGRVEQRLREHLPKGPDPIPGGVKVRVEPKSNITEARESEARIIKRSQPKHNKKGK